MKKWLVNSILLLALAGNAAMGMPLHSNEDSCPMGQMDCCKKAASAQNATQVTASRLCCSLNCPQSGTTPANANTSSPQPLSVSARPGSIQIPSRPVMLLTDASHHHCPPAYSSPTYIRHLALLI